MLTEAEILNIDHASNVCEVRIPVFETVNTLFPSSVTAVFACPPGVYNGFKKGDLVWVAFELNKPEKPIILGKIYRGVGIESQETGSAINCVDLNVTKSANLPVSTKILDADSRYDSFNKIVNELITLKMQPTERYLVLMRGKYNNDTQITLCFTTNVKYNKWSETIVAKNLYAAGFKVLVLPDRTEIRAQFPVIVDNNGIGSISADNNDNIYIIKNTTAYRFTCTYFECFNTTNV